MKTFKCIMDKHSESANERVMHDLTDVISNFTEDMRASHPKEVEEFLCEVEDIVCPYVSETDAMEITSGFVNKDTTTGEHWNKTQTDEVAAKYRINTDGERFNDWDFYVTLNMMYSDYYNTKFSLDEYVQLAKDWLTDPDWSEPGKTKAYFNLKK